MQLLVSQRYCASLCHCDRRYLKEALFPVSLSLSLSCAWQAGGGSGSWEEKEKEILLHVHAHTISLNYLRMSSIGGGDHVTMIGHVRAGMRHLS